MSATVGIVSCEREGASAFFGEGGGGAGDDATDGEVAAVDGDCAGGGVAEGDCAGAEVEIICAGEGDVGIPVLGIVAGEGDAGAAGVVEATSVDGECTGSDGGGVIKHQGAAVERGAAGVGIGRGEGEVAGAALNQ